MENMKKINQINQQLEILGVKINTPEIEIMGTGLVGNINVDYNFLVQKLGQPTESDGYKIDAEWNIEFDDGTVATIYNYKDGKNYLGEDGLDVEEITDWHVGGKSNKSLKLVKEYLGL